MGRVSAFSYICSHHRLGPTDTEPCPHTHLAPQPGPPSASHAGRLPPLPLQPSECARSSLARKALAFEGALRAQCYSEVPRGACGTAAVRGDGGSAAVAPRAGPQPSLSSARLGVRFRPCSLAPLSTVGLRFLLADPCAQLWAPLSDHQERSRAQTAPCVLSGLKQPGGPWVSPTLLPRSLLFRPSWGRCGKGRPGPNRRGEPVGLSAGPALPETPERPLP